MVTNPRIPMLTAEDRVHLEEFDRPPEFLDAEDSEAFRQSLSSSSLPEIAAAGRLWEKLLREHRDIFFLIRVADMRNTLNSKYTALRLYREVLQVQRRLDTADPYFDRWVDGFEKLTAVAIAKRQNQLSKVPILPSQRWKSIIGAPLPYITLPKAQLQRLRSQWVAMRESPKKLFEGYLNHHCIETNVIEGVFTLHPSAVKRLVNAGFFDPRSAVLRPDEVESGSEVTDCATILDILRDTRHALDAGFDLLETDSFQLTIPEVCRLHEISMRSCRVLCVSSPGSPPHLSYTNVGETRQTTRTKVTIQTSRNSRIQFCPHERVDEELRAVCEKITVELAKKHDPFALAAYISDIFVSVHPFEDGNGRVSRIISSLPLMKAGLPPICIPVSMRTKYHQHLNVVRSARDGDYELLAKFLFDATSASVGSMAALYD